MGWEGGSTVGGPKAATNSQNSSNSKLHQEHCIKNRSNKKSSNKQQNQEQHKHHKQQPRNNEGQEVWVPNVGRESVFPWNSVRLCSRFLFS